MCKMWAGAKHRRKTTYAYMRSVGEAHTASHASTLMTSAAPGRNMDRQAAPGHDTMSALAASPAQSSPYPTTAAVATPSQCHAVETDDALETKEGRQRESAKHYDRGINAQVEGAQAPSNMLTQIAV